MKMIRKQLTEKVYKNKEYSLLILLVYSIWFLRYLYLNRLEPVNNLLYDLNQIGTSSFLDRVLYNMNFILFYSAGTALPLSLFSELLLEENYMEMIRKFRGYKHFIKVFFIMVIYVISYILIHEVFIDLFLTINSENYIQHVNGSIFCGLVLGSCLLVNQLLYLIKQEMIGYSLVFMVLILFSGMSDEILLFHNLSSVVQVLLMVVLTLINMIILLISFKVYSRVEIIEGVLE